MSGIEQFSLQNKVIVITGATGVLGKAFSLSVAQAGAKVAVLRRNKQKAEERIAAIKANRGEAISILNDVLDELRMTAAKKEIL